LVKAANLCLYSSIGEVVISLPAVVQKIKGKSRVNLGNVAVRERKWDGASDKSVGKLDNAFCS
jgi:hypothetical protein